MAIKVCIICGKEFIDYGRGKYCKGPHYKTCIICGKEFEYNCRSQYIPKTCSKSCSSILARSNSKYSEKVCLKCGKVYKPTSSKQKYCKYCVDNS